MVFQYLKVGVFFFLVKSLELSIPVFSMIIFVPMLLILSNVPLTVAGLGLRESLVLLFFSSYGGKECILVLGMLFSFSEFIVPALFGLVFVKSFLKKIF
jgi:glycosyltransferase 2 family protein